ncbi:hypothetical protein CDEST_01258 [Colletotrichum destructivum]|uniref:Uncharacterized protein n=1 Tax=Colletotrichum destructivum TaxID=34406 RepID=A0AAX4HZ73_9PEZI|nr:hypothetical protein CDEST_01258 [Colletotrichum destructivum]
MNATRENDPDETDTVSGADNRRHRQEDEEEAEEINPQSRGVAVDEPSLMLSIAYAFLAARRRIVENGNVTSLYYPKMTFHTTRMEDIVEQAIIDEDTFGHNYEFVDTFRYYRKKDEGDRLANLDDLKEIEAISRSMTAAVQTPLTSFSLAPKL